MAYLEGLEDRSDPIWTELLANFDSAMADVSCDEMELNAVKEIRSMIDEYGYKKLYSCLIEHLKEPDIDFIYWFARAGARDVIPTVEKFLASSDLDEVVVASVSLALVGDRRGIEIIESLCSGTFRLKLDQTPYWHFSGYIEHIEDPRAREIEKKHF